MTHCTHSCSMDIHHRLALVVLSLHNVHFQLQNIIVVEQNARVVYGVGRAKPRPCHIKLKLALSLHKEGAIFELCNFLERLLNGRIR